MLYTKINYYSHLLLNSKYSLLIKLTIILSIYALFYIDSSTDIAYCVKMNKKQWMEKAQDQQMEINRLKVEIVRLKNELNTRFQMSSDTQTYYPAPAETLESIKRKVEAYRLSQAEGFLTTEERLPESQIRVTGVERPEFHFRKTSHKFEEMPTYLPFVYGHNNVNIGTKETLSCGKEVTTLFRNFRYVGTNADGFSDFKSVSLLWPFYDMTEYSEDVFYPANHPDNNYNPEAKRLYKIVGRKCYDKQLPDQLYDNCNIS